MIPLIDDFLQMFIAEKLKWLKDHPVVIDHIFSTGKRETVAKLRDFIENKKLKVIIGFPQNQTSLPAYVITLAPEQEQPAGLGDNSDTYNGYDLGIGEDSDSELVEDAVEQIKHFIAGTYMNSTYRIECWSDNGDLTAYMYTILKWCMWSSRQQMLDLGWVNITMSGMDLEPVPDYMPVFIYRRAGQISLTYENLYYENVESLNDYVDIIDHPDKYHKDEDGNIVDEDGNVIVPHKFTWIIRAHYYEKSIGDGESVESGDTNIIQSIITGVTSDGNTTINGLTSSMVTELPEVGETNVLYLLLCTVEGQEAYRSYIWVDGEYKPIGATDKDLSNYATIVVVDEKDTTVLGKATSYTDNKTYTAEDVGVTILGSQHASKIFNDIFDE